MIMIMYDPFLKRLIALAKPSQAVPQAGYLFHCDDPVEFMFIVQSGMLELVRFRSDGASVTLQRAGPGSLLAEASAYSDRYHCDAIATTQARVCKLRKFRFLKLLRDDETLAMEWAARLAREVQSTRSQVEILSQKTVADRLDHWLLWHGEALPEKGYWKNIAPQIGVSAEALYRELAKRRSP